MDEHEEMFTSKPVIRVIGVGGGGGSAVNRMIDNDLKEVEYVVINTDCQVLRLSKAETRIQIGKNVTNGFGAGGKPEKGKESALENIDDIRACVEGADLVFITAGMGGGTGTGAAPIVAQCAKEAGCLVVGFVTKPFSIEGKLRMHNALQGIEEMRPYVDTLVVIPNDKLLQVIGTNTPYIEALAEVDDVLRQGVEGISEIINRPGIISLDFADITTVLKNKGNALMGIGKASGPNRAVEAARSAISSPLLEVDINGATDAIVQIISDDQLTMKEVEDAMQEIRRASSTDIDIIQGTALNLDLDGEVVVIVIATGFDSIKAQEKDQFEESKDENYKDKDKQDEETEKQDFDGVNKGQKPKTKVPSWLTTRFR